MFGGFESFAGDGGIPDRSHAQQLLQAGPRIIRKEEDGVMKILRQIGGFGEAAQLTLLNRR
ncbi:MAG: hypothetical protein ACRD3T_21560, partial [Terriglobia bacterium]